MKKHHKNIEHNKHIGKKDKKRTSIKEYPLCENQPFILSPDNIIYGGMEINNTTSEESLFYIE